MALPPNEYHLEIISREIGSHGDFASMTPFPTFRPGDIISAGSFSTGGTMAIPEDSEQVVMRVEHHIAFWDAAPPNFPDGINHITTVVFTELQKASAP